MVHRHILLFDPLKIELKQIGPETVWHPIFKPRRRALLINPKDPATTLFAHIALRIGIADHRMFPMPRRPVIDQGRIAVHDDELMFHGNRWHLDAQHPRRALRMVAARGHHMFRRDDDLLVRRHKVAALLDHLGAGHFPMRSIPMEPIRLPLALDRHTTLPRALGHRHGHIGGVNIAISLMIKRPLQIRCLDQRPLRLDLIGGKPLIGHTTGLGGGSIEHILIHPRIRLGHAQIAHHGKARVQPRLRLQRLIKLDRILMNMGGRVRHVEQGQKPRRMPSRARGQLVPLQEHHIIPTGLRQMIGDRRANRAAPDNQCFDLRFHLPIPLR